MIKEYELFKGGGTFLEVYKNIDVVTLPGVNQFYKEYDELKEMEAMLKANGATEFRLIFGEGKLEQKVSDEEEINDLSKEEVSSPDEEELPINKNPLIKDQIYRPLNFLTLNKLNRRQKNDI